MALRLGEYVEWGELDNRRKNATAGWLQLRGQRERVSIELTGDMSPDLAGKRIRFACSKNQYKSVERLSADGKSFPLRVIGATGDMTADHQVRLFDCPIDEFLRRSKLGEPPPTFWRRCLYLEWHGTGGRGVVELPDARIWIVEDGEDGEAMSPLPDEMKEPFDPNDPPEPEPGSFEAIEVAIGDDGQARVTRHDFAEEEEEANLESDDPYALFSDDFKKLIQAEGEETAESEFIKEMAKMEDIWEGRVEGDRLGDLLGPPPDWEALGDEEIESLFKSAVAKLALFNIAYDVCEHFTVREACRRLFEDLADCEIHPQMAGGSWFSHFSTSDDCRQCDEEFE